MERRLSSLLMILCGLFCVACHGDPRDGEGLHGGSAVAFSISIWNSRGLDKLPKTPRWYKCCCSMAPSPMLVGNTRSPGTSLSQQKLLPIGMQREHLLFCSWLILPEWHREQWCAVTPDKMVDECKRGWFFCPCLGHFASAAGICW